MASRQPRPSSTEASASRSTECAYMAESPDGVQDRSHHTRGWRQDGNLVEEGAGPTNGAVTLVPTTSDQTIEGYHNGSGKCAGDTTPSGGEHQERG